MAKDEELTYSPGELDDEEFTYSPGELDDEEFTYSPGELDDEDDEKDMEWEDVVTSRVVVGPTLSQLNDGPTSQEANSENLNEYRLHQIDWKQVNLSLAEEHAKSNTRKRRRPPIRLTKDEKQREKTLHQTHLLLLLSSHIKWIQLSRSQLLRGLLLSLTAGSDVDFFAEIKQQLAYSLSLLVRWFNQEFRVTEENLYSNRGIVTESSLMDVFFARKGRKYELTLLFAALCGALQLRYRLTCALDPLLVQQGKTFEASFTQKPSKQRRSRKIDSILLKKKLVSDKDKIEEVDKELDRENPESVDQVFWLWCEALDEKSNKWIHVDVLRRLVDCPQEVEPLRGKAARFSYVISFQDDGLLVDVTSRYTLRWSKSFELRIADSWLKQVLEKLNEDRNDMHIKNTAAASTLLTTKDMDRVLDDEKKKLEAMKLGEGMPASLEGFRKHHLYCLERHLGQFECIHPRKVVGVFNGQSVFLREHVQYLRSAFKWRRLGRVVKDDERKKPVKWQSRRGLDPGDNNNVCSSTGEGESDNTSLALYGLWQTTEIKPSPVVDNRVPKNKYGNIEIWSPAHIPRGAVHLQLPRIDTIAKSLGIDFAPAVVGFEVRNGRTMPKMAGIVVSQSYEAMLLDAHAEKQQQVIEKAIVTNRKLVLKRWEKLTKRLLLRQRLEDDYGAV